ncbi:unnamed protein product [Ceutorhynchus assimilis]|uniref:Major facilitator superfamily (MFS) profile domain-containing protein n=1 Tax=Ceutorhynchus assimilis TaxID=467358 RepID=A0A9N9N310_9CUCU|nr:unnamed protein product [Ceutorhynchus assimilis]
MSDAEGTQNQPKKTRFCCDPVKCRCCNYRIPQRFVMAIMLHLALQNNFNTRVVLNVAIVEMVAPPQEENITEVACPEFGTPEPTQKGGKFPWPAETRALVLYAFYIGYTVLQVPGGWIADKYGARYVILICVLVTTATTAIFPICTQSFGHVAAIVLRFILGMAHSPTMPALSSMVSTWLPPSERAGWGGIAYAGTNLGTILSNILTGVLIHAFDGWPVAFYFWSIYSAIFFFFVLLYLFSFPDTHPFISKEEADFIRNMNSNNRAIVGRSLKTPWLKIISNMPYWANIAAQFAHNYIYFSLVTYLPTYLRDILQFDVSEDGYFSAIPFIALWVTSLILGGTAHYFIRFMTEKWFNIICGAGCNVASAALMVGAVYAGCNRMICIALYILSMILKAFYYVTLTTNINALSRNHGGLMFGFCNALGSLSGIIGNAIIGSLTKDKQFKGWEISFWIMLGVASVTTLFFFIFSSVERQKFDYDEDTPMDQ